MTDEEIRDLVYEYATAFTSTIHFTEQGIQDFARAVLDHTSRCTAIAAKPGPSYETELDTLLASSARYLNEPQ